jgi:hypothetical protein
MAMVALALLNLVCPGLGLFLRREALQGMLYFLATALVFSGTQSGDPDEWWIGVVWGAAQLHFLRARHLGTVCPFGRVGRALFWTVAGLGVLSIFWHGRLPCPPCVLLDRPLLETVGLIAGLLLPAGLLTWGLAPIRWPEWLAARLAPAAPPTPTEQAPLWWVALASLNLLAMLAGGLGPWESGHSLNRLLGNAIAFSWLTLHIGTALALVPMGLCLARGWARALPWVLVGLWSATTGVLLLARVLPF